MFRYKAASRWLLLQSSEDSVSESSTMAPSVKLTYFNGRGRSEPARLLLAYGGIEYEDCRLTPAFEVELSTNIREVSQSLENAPTSAPSH